MRNNTAVIIALLIIVGTGYVVIRNIDSVPSNNIEIKNKPNLYVENVIVRDGVQYVTITTRGGYFPRQSIAKAGVPTKIIMKTDGTYDCSLALVIRSLNYRNMLPNTGETIIDAGVPKVGDILQGVCSMGMYSFRVHFNN